MSWRNPHCSFVLEATDEHGAKEEWLVEMLAKIALERNGFDFDALPVHAHLTVTGLKGRREHTIFFRAAEFPDGRVLRWQFASESQE